HTSVRGPSLSTLFPYTTLFRSERVHVTTDGIDPCTHVREPCTSFVGDAAVASLQTPSLDLHQLARELCDAGGHLALPRTTCTLRSEEHTSELQSRENLVCRLLL